MREWMILLKPPLLNANTQMHWAIKAKKVKEIRSRAAWLAMVARIPRLQKAIIIAVVHPGVRTRRFDPQNWAPSVKAAIDGLVDAGVLPDDSAKYLLKLTYEAGTPWPSTGVELRIRARQAP